MRFEAELETAPSLRAAWSSSQVTRMSDSGTERIRLWSMG